MKNLKLRGADYFPKLLNDRTRTRNWHPNSVYVTFSPMIILKVLKANNDVSKTQIKM